MAELPAKLAAEFLGTFLLVFTVGCNVLSGNAAWGVTSIASVLMVSIYALGGISGANFNPAVSVTLGIVQKLGFEGGLDWKTICWYVLTQLAAGTVAGGCYLALFGTAFNLSPAEGFGLLSAGLCELLYTFMLCFVVLNTACSGAREASLRKPKDQFFGLAIGFVIVAGGYGAGAVSGGCFNPAVAFGIDIASAYLGFGACLSYILFELLGAALAAVMFFICRPEDFGKAKKDYVPMVSEFLGTYILVLTVGLNVLGKSPAGAFSIAAALMSMIYSLGDVSGAHFNPAVTVAIFASGLNPDLKPEDVAKYIGSQLAGGVCAAFTYSAIYAGASFNLGPVGSASWSQVAIAETIFTYLLCFVVLGAAVADTTKTTQFFGLAIGSCVTVGGFAIGGISGGSLNPAVSFGLASAHVGAAGAGVLGNACAYTAMELCGAVMAAGVVKVTHEDTTGDDSESQKIKANI